MKKMNAPKMETVRFEENDVIVASGAGNDKYSMFVSKFGNGTTGDGSIKYNGTTYSGDNLLGVMDSLEGQLNNGNPFLGNFKTVEGAYLSKFIKSDLGEYGGTDDEVDSDWNGSYYWNSEFSSFEKG